MNKKEERRGGFMNIFDKNIHDQLHGIVRSPIKMQSGNLY